MSILSEAMEQPKLPEEIGAQSSPEQQTEQPEQQGLGFMDIIRIPTGPGSLEEYKESPLNFDKSEALARVIRGLAGLLGADIVRSAVVDIIFGVFQWVQARRGAVNAQG